MSETASTKTKRNTVADYKALTEQLLERVNRLEEQMEKDHAEIERQKAEIKLIKERTIMTLTQLIQGLDIVARKRS